MDLAGGLGIGVLDLVAGYWMVRRRHHLAAWFSAGLLLAIAGLVAIVAALSGATVGNTLAIAGSVVAVIMGMCLWPKGDFTKPDGG